MDTLAFGYQFAEAPRSDDQGNVYFSDVLGGGVYRWSPDGSIATVVPKRRGVGGLVLHADGGVVVSGKDICHVREGETRRLLALVGAVGFNDLITDSAGRVFVGSLRSSAFEAGPRVPGELWRIDGADRAVQVYGDVAFANGVGFSPDGRTIFHSNYSVREVLAHDLGLDGVGTNRRVFARVPSGHPDGLAVDEAGGVWVALGDGGGIARFRPDGSLDRVVAVPSSFVASLCFGGSDRRDVYIVTADNTEDPSRRATLFRTRSDVPGLIAPLARV